MFIPKNESQLFNKIRCKNYYELNKTQFIRPDSLKMFLVAVPKENDPAGSRVKIEGLLKDYKNGKKSIDQMRRDGQDPKTAGYGAADLFIMKVEQHAAQLGVTYERLLNIFKEDTNKPSEILETGNAWEFYEILDKYPFKALEISDVIRPESTQTRNNPRLGHPVKAVAVAGTKAPGNNQVAQHARIRHPQKDRRRFDKASFLVGR